MRREADAVDTAQLRDDSFPADVYKGDSKIRQRGKTTAYVIFSFGAKATRFCYQAILTDSRVLSVPDQQRVDTYTTAA